MSSIHDLTPGFTISYLLMSQNGTPATAFEAGTAIDFSWESTGDYFRLFAGKNTTPIYEGTASNTTLSKGPTVDTTFTLEATSDNSKLYKSITAIILNPSLTPSSMTIAGDHTVDGELLVAGNSTFNQLDVTGILGFPNPQEPDFAIDGYLQTNCKINVTGNTTVKGTLNADSAKAHNAAVKKSLTVLNGTVSLFNDSISVYSGNDAISKTFVAKCDGYFLAYLQTDPSTWAKIILKVDSYSFNVQGGNVIDSSFKDVVSNSVLLPLSKGTSLTYSTFYFPVKPAAFTLQWYPIGPGAAQEATYEIIDMPANKMKATAPDIAALQTARKAARMETATSFIQNIERACNKTIDDNMKQLLVEKLLTLK